MMVGQECTMFLRFLLKNYLRGCGVRKGETSADGGRSREIEYKSGRQSRILQINPTFNRPHHAPGAGFRTERKSGNIGETSFPFSPSDVESRLVGLCRVDGIGQSEDAMRSRI